MTDKRLKTRNRRHFLSKSGAVIGGSIVAGPLLGHGSEVSGSLPTNDPTASSMILISLTGGPSQLDTLDFKPELLRMDGKSVRDLDGRTKRIVGPRWKFRQHGQSGIWMSDLFPNLSRHVDRMAVVHGVSHGALEHRQAKDLWRSMLPLSGKPSGGAVRGKQIEKASMATRHLFGVDRLYGVDRPECLSFGSDCLSACNRISTGQRFVHIPYRNGQRADAFDAHRDLVANHSFHAKACDQPIAGLIADLSRRGLLDSTLVVCAGEFGRQPFAEYDQGNGRDHQSDAFSIWMAGGGIRNGIVVGETDDLGRAAAGAQIDLASIQQLFTTLGSGSKHSAVHPILQPLL